MDYLLTAEGMRQAERIAMDNGISDRVLMTNAAKSLYDLLEQNPDVFPCKRPAVVCGAGNNGGDGMVLALLLKHRGIDVTVWYAGPLQNDGTPDPSHMTDLLSDAYEDAAAMDIPVLTDPAAAPGSADCIIDAVFGIGLTRAVSGTAAVWIRRINEAGLPVLAVDIPSGIAADTGEVMGVAVRADMTACLGRCKRGLFLFPGADHCGRIVLCDIGIPADVTVPLSSCEVLFDNDLPDLLPSRPIRSHKGVFGTVASLCGSENMCGAALLSAKAAYRTGVGLVNVITPVTNRSPLFSALPEAVVHAYDTVKTGKIILKNVISRADVLLAGCGLGTGKTAAQLLQTALTEARRCSVPVVLDADALNLIAENKVLRRLIPAGSIVTPHMGEAARLLGKTAEEIAACPLRAAQELSAEYGVVCLLKDAHTVIVSPDGSTTLNLSGSNALATAGSGDVLAGIIAALIAGGCNRDDAAKLGAFIHGRAGEAAAAKISARAVMASDICDAVGDVLLQADNA